MNVQLLGSFILATSALAISPGPDNIYVMMQSLINGKRFGLATVAGLISGCIVHTTLVAFGASAIIKTNDVLFSILKLFGAGYLIYLAISVYRSNHQFEFDANQISIKTEGQLFKQGFIMNVLNPKVSIFFLAFFPGFLFSNTLNSVIQFYVLGFLFMLVSAIIFSAIALLAGSISKYLRRNSKVGFYLKWMQIIVFLGIAFLILTAKN
ncbi:MAG: LysE family translocator [Bacteroidota bacterium]